MTDRSYIGKFNIATSKSYASNIYFLNNDTGLPPPPPPPPVVCNFILQEDGSYILLEDNVSRLELECNAATLFCSFLLQEDGFRLLQEDNVSFIELECGELPMITFSITLTGPWAAPHSVTMQYQKNGNLASLYIPRTLFAATSSSLITSTTSLPAAIVPSVLVGTAFQSGLPVINNSLDCDGAATVAPTTGILTIGLNIVGLGESLLLNPFQNSGNAGFDNLVFTYLTI